MFTIYSASAYRKEMTGSNFKNILSILIVLLDSRNGCLLGTVKQRDNFYKPQQYVQHHHCLMLSSKSQQ